MALPRTDGWVDWTEGYRYEPLDPQERFTTCPTNTSRWRVPARNTLLLCWVVFCAVSIWVGSRGLLHSDRLPAESEGGPALLEADRIAQTSDSMLNQGDKGSTKVRIANNYQREKSATVVTMYPWVYRAEPHRETWLEIVEWQGAFTTGENFRWEPVLAGYFEE